MRLIPFCHQWILKISSRSVKLFVNHNGGTVEISFNFQGQEVSREFKWGIVSWQSLIRPQCFLKDLHPSVEKTPDSLFHIFWEIFLHLLHLAFDVFLHSS